MMYHSMSTILAVTMLVVTLAATFALPVAVAHDCAAYNGDDVCDPPGCCEGEGYGAPHCEPCREGDNENCRTPEEDDEDDAPKRCEYVPIELPPRVRQIPAEPEIAR